jgi:hypothetical protein
MRKSWKTLALWSEAAALAGFVLLAGLVPSRLFAGPKPESASAVAAAPCEIERLIPVATLAGVVRMTERDYDSYVAPMGHLPVLSREYVFGRTIPQPKTDKHGHIHLSGQAAPGFKRRQK